MSKPSCGEVCEALIHRVEEMGFPLTDDDDHSDILDALDQCLIVRRTEDTLKEAGETGHRIRAAAARVWLGHSADPDIEIDADAKVSIAGDGSGAFVQAWLWVDSGEFEREAR